MTSAVTRSAHAAAPGLRPRARERSCAARVGIGGPVGSGKTALLEQIIPRLIRRGTSLAVITNELATQEDAERVRRSGLIDPARVMAVETGPSPHVAIDQDPGPNMRAVRALETRFGALDLILIESGGDSLAATFSLALVDYWLFVIDVAGGDDIPRKKGLGVLQCNLLVINKVDLAPYVGVDLERMVREASEIRTGRPVLLTNCKSGEGLDAVVDTIAAETHAARNLPFSCG
ncbi:MAG TPA: urease accessory protein UreG [Burkholderiales bacterium]|nr:urease accessory protein UreG [Burkholderiales bacterium]